MKKLFVITFAVISLFALSTSALACACCAERGTYTNWTGTPDKYQTGLLKDMKFGSSAELYMTAGEFEDIKGIADIETEFDSGKTNFDIVEAYLNNSWRIDIKTPSGKAGTLVLPRPAKMSIMRIDTHEKSEANTEITVYKEFQFKGQVRTGSGVFRKGLAAPATYQLIFQGRGNMCDNAEDFNHWRLEIKGSKANYAFFGPMKFS